MHVREDVKSMKSHTCEGRCKDVKHDLRIKDTNNDVQTLNQTKWVSWFISTNHINQ